MAASMKPLIVASAVTELNTLAGDKLNAEERTLLRAILANLPGTQADMLRATLAKANARMAIEA